MHVVMWAKARKDEQNFDVPIGNTKFIMRQQLSNKHTSV